MQLASKMTTKTTPHALEQKKQYKKRRETFKEAKGNDSMKKHTQKEPTNKDKKEHGLTDTGAGR